MIKIEGKGNSVKAEIMGDEVTVLSELTYAVKHIHGEIGKVRGKKVADENMKAVFKLALMSEEELDDRWIDMDTGGDIYNHYGIEINETGQDYNSKGVYHLD